MENQLLSLWGRFQKFPAGKWIFSKLVGLKIPYTGSISPRVLEVGPGFSKVKLIDRRGLRNHLKSVHAVALMNLAEFSTGLAMTAQIDHKTRAIITHLSMDYHKKARGVLIAECNYPNLDTTVSKEHNIQSQIRDASGVVVATGTARWLVGPKKIADSPGNPAV